MPGFSIIDEVLNWQYQRTLKLISYLIDSLKLSEELTLAAKLPIGRHFTHPSQPSKCEGSKLTRISKSVHPRNDDLCIGSWILDVIFSKPGIVDSSLKGVGDELCAPDLDRNTVSHEGIDVRENHRVVVPGNSVRTTEACYDARSRRRSSCSDSGSCDESRPILVGWELAQQRCMKAWSIIGHTRGCLLGLIGTAATSASQSVMATRKKDIFVYNQVVQNSRLNERVEPERLRECMESKESDLKEWLR